MLGVPGRGGASGNELRRLGGWDEKDGDEPIERLSEMALGAEATALGAEATAGAEGVFASADPRATTDELWLTGGGGGVWEFRVAPASTSSISASGSTSDSSLGSCIISAVTSRVPSPLLVWCCALGTISHYRY
jgi:hypothetical protein